MPDPDDQHVLAAAVRGSVTPFGQGTAIQLYGAEGVLFYDLLEDRIYGLSRTHAAAAESLREIPIPPEKARGWQAEADFVDSIRLGTPVQLTNFETGVAYMEFTDAVARSGVTVKLPLSEAE